jgi:DNA repair exonuclease SbcCD ATPase subunit
MNQADVSKVIGHFQEMSGRRDLLRDQLKKAQENESWLSERLDKSTKARALIQHAAQITQQNLEYHISHLISLALAAVWTDPYNFKVNFVKRRNKTECDLKLERNGEELDPVFASGGGVCDVVAFALQIAFLTMNKSNRKVFITDEPFSFLHSPTLQKNCSEMVKTISEKTGIQIIMVSDQSNIIDYSDKEIRAELVKGETKMKEVT